MTTQITHKRQMLKVLRTRTVLDKLPYNAWREANLAKIRAMTPEAHAALEAELAEKKNHAKKAENGKPKSTTLIKIQGKSILISTDIKLFRFYISI